MFAISMLVALCACASRPGEPTPTAATGPSATEPSPVAPTKAPDPRSRPVQPPDLSAPAQPAPAPAVRDVVLITDRGALAEVAAAGGALGALLHGRAAANNRELAQHARYASIARVIERDISAIQAADPKAGVGIRGNAHRLFDRRWLRARMARYELVAVSNRVDKTPFWTDRCGDIRLIYRLAYTTEVSGEVVTSRLPMTIMVALTAPPRFAPDPAAGCNHRAWRAPADARGAALGQWLVSDRGPLSQQILTPDRVDQVLINVQVVRWPSAVRPDLGGHAEYVLRQFRPSGAGMKPGPMDNTPKVARLRKNKRLRGELRAWIAANLDRIDAGTIFLPDRFTATKAVSVTPRGLSRRANRPFRQIFRADDFAEIDLTGRSRIRSPEALLRRLDDMSCVGCHQARTIAGFHLLGEDGADVAAGNALHVHVSPHVGDEIERRTAISRALASGQAPDWSRPFAERGPRDRGTSGSRCGLGDDGFRAWTCADGYECVRYDAPNDDAVIGTCMRAGASDVGEACEFGPLRAHRNAHRDHARKGSGRACAGDAVCNINRTGFPGGMCTASCDGLPASGACGVIALLGPFNSCLARKTPFPRCLAEHVSPAGLRACDLARPCRDDYICARTPGGEGACMPPYFLFQLRVDGHIGR